MVLSMALESHIEATMFGAFCTPCCYGQQPVQPLLAACLPFLQPLLNEGILLFLELDGGLLHVTR